MVFINAMHNNNWLIWICVILSLSWLFGGAFFLYTQIPSCPPDSVCKIINLEPNQIGDALAGLCSPVVFLWIVITSLLQRNELELQRKDIQDSKLEAAAQTKALVDSNNLIIKQFEAETEKLHESRRAAINRAIFILVRQRNAAIDLYREFEIHIDPMARAFSMPAFKAPSFANLRLDLVSLEFLFDSTEPNLIFRLLLEEDRFHKCLEILDLRNSLHADEIQKLVEKSGLNGTDVPISAFKEILGDKNFYAAINYAEQLERHLSAFKTTSLEMLNDMYSLAKLIYPDNKFLKFVWQE